MIKVNPDIHESHVILLPPYQINLIITVISCDVISILTEELEINNIQFLNIS